MTGVTVVTGAASGLGRAITEDLLSRGMTVIAVDIDDGALAELRKSSSSDALATHACDVSSESSVAHLGRVAQSQGEVSAVVHSAGLVAVTRAPASDLTVEEFDRVMAVNARGSWLIAREFIPHLAAARGSLVLFSSDTAFTGSHGLSHYVASKGAVLSMMRAFAGEAGPSGVRVNAIAPGYTDTAGGRGIGDPDRYDVKPTPLGRIGYPADLLGTVRYLLSDDSAFVTGQTIHVNGGRYVS